MLKAILKPNKKNLNKVDQLYYYMTKNAVGRTKMVKYRT